MKPWNKIKWQKENVKLANKPLDDFDAYMNEICSIHGVRRWDCIKQDHQAVEQSVQSDECPVCWGRGFNYVFEAQIDCAACNGTGIRR